METKIFITPRRGLMGNKPLGADYMLEVKERAQRMKAATRDQGELLMAIEKRQQRLPGF